MVPKCNPLRRHALSPKKRIAWNLIGWELPVSVKPGWIMSQLLPKHGLELSYNPTKHKPIEKSTGLPLSEEHLGGRRFRPTDQGFVGKKLFETSEYLQTLQWTLACLLKCGGKLK